MNALANEDVKIKAMDDGAAAGRALAKDSMGPGGARPEATAAIEALGKRETPVDGIDEQAAHAGLCRRHDGDR